MLINKKHVKAFALSVASQRAHKFTRVSAEFYVYLDAAVREKIRNYIHTLPSVGATIK